MDKLHTRAGQKCQRLLTHAKLGRKGPGGLLDRLEGFVDLERLSKVLRALGLQIVVAHAANKGRANVSAAADTFPNKKVWAGGALQPGERLVDLDCLGEVLGASGSDVVGGDAANGKGIKCQRLLTLCQIGRWGLGRLT